MSDQGPIPDRGADDFGLIETVLWTQEAGFELLPEHLARLKASSTALGFRHNSQKVRAALDAAVAAPPAARLRVRLVLSRNGAVETSLAPIDPLAPGTVWRVALAQRRFASDDPLLRHKTTRRALYEDELARAMAQERGDEIVFLNERAEVCESARCNLFVPEGEVLLTPPLESGLLPGTLRARLLAQGHAREAILRLPQLRDGFFLGNSVRGLVHARLIDQVCPGFSR